MKIYVLGSTAFMRSMVKARDDLKKIGLDGWIHKDYDLLVRGELPAQQEQYDSGERAAIKKHRGYLRVHYKHILESDAVLIVNEAKMASITTLAVTFSLKWDKRMLITKRYSFCTVCQKIYHTLMKY